MRKTKIVCTIGPATDDETILQKLIQQGMDVARLNFSHGTHEEQLQRVNLIKRISREENRPVAILMDTKGPEIRTGRFKDGGCYLNPDSEVWIRSEEILGNEKEFSVTYKYLAQDLKPGNLVLIDDGLIELRVLETTSEDVRCHVVNGGHVSDRKGINLPNVRVHLPALTDKDVEDIEFAIENDFDFIAVSFVRRATDVYHVREILEKNKGEFIQLIAKIENQEGVDNFDEILDASDGIMVARGDLGVELKAQHVPIIQKQMIEACYSKGKPCITATQMLDSMMRNPRPTRAEVSDVANAIIDGTSAIMLSGETAAGKYPLQSFAMMNEIACSTEDSIDYWEFFRTGRHAAAPSSAPSVTNAVSHACCTTAMDVKAKAIVAVTIGGRTARMMSRFRPECPVIAPTTSERCLRQLSLSWGVVPILSDEIYTTDELFEAGMQRALDTGLVAEGDVVVISGGTPVGVSGMTNTLKVQTIGRLLSQGVGIERGKITGDVFILTPDTIDELRSSGAHNLVLVVIDTDNSMIDVIKQANAIIAESDSPDCHAVTVGKLLDIPVVYNCQNARKIFKNGMPVTVDSDRGIVN
ncbi:MAG TPA: pyruvate kinase [Clostridiaceae bacterium]|nr:pyruvate kinase [Clostridiaceae bacterium]